MSKLKFDFIVNKEQHTMTVVREFAASRPLVWDAYTKSELLEKWWAPKPWKSVTKTMDFREGGIWHYAMRGPEGEEHWGIADYLEIRPQEFFKARDSFADGEGNRNTELPVSHWQAEFTESGDITRVEYKVEYSSLEQLETVLKMGMKEGLTMAMEGLDEVLEKMKK